MITEHSSAHGVDRCDTYAIAGFSTHTRLVWQVCTVPVFLDPRCADSDDIGSIMLIGRWLRKLHIIQCNLHSKVH